MSVSEQPAEEYDYLIIGGGAAGLSLAYHMAQEPRLADKRVLLLEPEAKTQNDRTWSFWADEPSPFDGIVVGEWRQIAFRSPGFERVFDLGRYRYKTIRGVDYYRFVQAALAARPQQFRVLRGVVSELVKEGDRVTARSTAGDFRARYAFDSRPPRIQPRPDKYHYQVQHFVGWEVETDIDVFNPEVAEFMDFRGEQQQEARFIYVLPFSRRKALVEYTLFSGAPLEKSEYEAALREYLSTTLGLQDYRITDEEVGAIPMTDHPLPAQTGPNIVNIGTRGGRAKASTGYAFKRIQQQSARLAAALAATGQLPEDVTGDKWQFRLFDTLLLDIMQRRGETTRDIFAQLFANNPVERIFRFLDERTSWVDNLRIMNSVPAGPFMRSIWQVLRGRPGRRL
ncbi:lycopene cyclase family protein [Hymenobacter sp. ASUV-10]|uniref:Lycopene cyclase family protein n=1 Tax=Hymenobacter aranciens TaxID=3063996 RepID=A0ABT9B4M1_9BACT|nr:lycopene cyclase family protein [Hymenobacter sp. ASUV-10]MDO7873217.1 lycopene cyclase family protein [Hymenobacter sp. ASUV-10]